MYMTASPYSVEAHESLSRARAMMHEHRVRHLPVMRKGKLAGILSERDANLVEGLADAPAEAITVEDAMKHPIRFVGGAGGHASACSVAEEARRRGVRRLVFAHIGRPTIRAIDAGERPPFGQFGHDRQVFVLPRARPKTNVARGAR
jgi:predicted transcriptional regulator